MDTKAEAAQFLVSRRARLTPEQAGVRAGAGRRVPGLRRSEVAALAGVSPEYYARLERGALTGVSTTVLAAIARALQLDDAERTHLFHLAQAVDGTGTARRTSGRAAKRWSPRPALRWVLDSIAGPAIVRNPRMDLLACNALGRAMHASLYDADPGEVPNIARFTFLHEDGRSFYGDWGGAAAAVVSILHAEAQRDPHDKALHELVGELSTRSADFRSRWSRPAVRQPGSGTRRFHHELVGDLEFAYESVDLASEPGLNLTVYAADPASPSAQALRLLGSWSAAPATAGSASHGAR